MTGSGSGGQGGSWWSRLSRSEQALAIIIGAVISAAAVIVAAVLSNSSGSPSTAPSAPSFTTPSSTAPSTSPTPFDMEAPTTPTGLTATAPSPDQIDLSWAASRDNVKVVGYQVYRDGTPLDTTSSPSFSDHNVQRSTTYRYTVKAFDAAGNSSKQESNPVTLAPCGYNLIMCSRPVPVYVKNQSISSLSSVQATSLQVTFSNQTKGSGVALTLDEPFDVKAFRFVEIEGSSTKPVDFVVEYKVKPDLATVKTAGPRTFPTPDFQRVKLPLVYDGSVDEVVLNFIALNQSATFTISAVHLAT